MKKDGKVNVLSTLLFGIGLLRGFSEAVLVSEIFYYINLLSCGMPVASPLPIHQSPALFSLLPP